MLNKNRFDDVLVDADQSDQLIKIMDMFVILLEGGNENDFKILENNETESKTSKLASSTETKIDENEKWVENFTENLTIQIFIIIHLYSQPSVPVETKKPEEIDLTPKDDEEINDHTVTTTQEDDRGNRNIFSLRRNIVVRISF